MHELKKDACSSCDAPIYWAQLYDGEESKGFVPVDVEPATEPLQGELVLSLEPSGKLIARRAGLEHRAPRKRYHHHHTTCSHWRP